MIPSRRKWHSPLVRDKELVAKSGAPLTWQGEHQCSLYMGRGAPPFIKFPKIIDFSRKKACFDLEMMGFFLQYDLGVMENVFHVVKGL
jgi:hypothetical protein